MPAIKKKWIKASQDGFEAPDDENDEAVGDEDRELGTAEGATDAGVSSGAKPKKRPAQASPQNSLLKGLDGEVLLEKRKRFVRPAELKLSEWLDNNLEKRTEETLHLPHLYKYYTELCQGDESDICDVPEFNRMVREKFGKSFGVKPTSVYKSLIKERKLGQKKKAGIKLKAVVHEAINHFGNPWNGIRFFGLKTYIGTKYPALQIDLRPKILKRALEMGVQYGQIELVKGIGMAGFYRLPGGEPPPPPKPKVKAKKGGDEEIKAEEGEEKKTGEEGKGKGEKTEESAENGEKKEAEGEQKKKKKHKKKGKVVYSKMHHGSPMKIEDTFPLAITYQSAPKAAGVPRIRRYIQEKYGEIVSDARWRKAIENGTERNYWEHVSGSGITGKLHLLMDDFNPSSDQIEDMICAAIIACHEPKAASSNQIKKYVSQYHPEFKVEERPDKFKKALQRALAKNMILQLSGLGANGSFQLTNSFTPSPAVLAGDDASSEEEEYDSDEPVYVPRGTKSRGMPKVKTMEVVHSPPPRKSNKTKGTQKKSSSTSSVSKSGRSKKPIHSYADSSSEEEEEDEAPRRKKSSKKSPTKGKKKEKAAPKKRARSPSPVEEEDVDVEPEYTPRKTQSRGGSARQNTPAAKPASHKAAKPSNKKKAKASPAKAEATPDLASVKKAAGIKEAAKSDPSKTITRLPMKLKDIPPPAPAPTPTKRPRAGDSDEGDVDSSPEPEYTPRKSKSRGGGESTPSKTKEKSKGHRSRK